MKVFKFHIWEHWFGGTNERIIEVKARSLQSAEKKLRQIQGNRDWEYKLIQSVADAPDEQSVRLIAAAPELLEALRSLLTFDDSSNQPVDKMTWNSVRILIAKATGGES